MPLNGVVYLRDVSGNTASLTNSGEVKIAGSISATSNISGQVVLISGQPVTASVTTNISGQVVKISGETVTVSNDLTTAVSGETVYLVNDGVNNVVSISGQTVQGSFTTNVSGQAVRVSGETVYFADDGVNNVAKISGQTVYLVNDGNKNTVSVVGGATGEFADVLGSTDQDDELEVLNAFITAGFNYGYDDNTNRWARLRTTNSGDGFKLAVSISGQPVTTSVTTNISGQVVATSGQTVYFVDDSVNNKVKISGQTVTVEGTVSVDSLPVISVSGNAVKTSGQTVYFVDNGVNNVVKISGQTVEANVNVETNISGQVVYFVDNGVNNVVKISGQTVVANVQTDISGQAVRTSGQTVYLIDDSINNKVKISGQTVNTRLVDGTTPANVATVVANTEGSSQDDSVAALLTSNLNYGYNTPAAQWERLEINSVTKKLFVTVSGDTLAVSGAISINNSPTVLTSVSGNIVRISGSMVLISGQPVRLSIPTDISVRTVATCTAASGGTQLLSGDCRKATFINAGVSGQNIWLGSTTEPPFSGKGFYLLPGNGITLEISNFNIIRACSVVSGAFLSYGGERY